MGPSPVAQRLGRSSMSGIERGLLLREERGADAPGLHRLERLGIEVVVVEVFVRDHPHRAQPVGSEQPALLERLEAVGIGEQPGQQVAALAQDSTKPAEVVDPEVVEPQILGRAAERAGDPFAQVEGCVADPDHAVAQDSARRLGHESQ